MTAQEYDEFLRGRREGRAAAPSDKLLAVSPDASEEDFQSLVTAYAEARGWLWYHTRDSRRSNPGFLDLNMIRGPRIIYAECKSASGRLTPDQERWVIAAAGTPAEVHVWRPCDVERIVDVLA